MTSKMEFLDALVKQQPKLKLMTFKVIVCLAMYANSKDGGNAHPGEKRLAADVGISERRVRDHLNLLREAGWIQRVSRGSIALDRKYADVYALTIPALVDVPDAVNHRTLMCPVVNGSPTDGEASDHRTLSPDHRTLSPDHRTLRRPPTLACTPCPEHPSDPDGSGSSQAPIQQVDEVDEVAKFDKEWAYVEQEVGGLSPEEADVSLGMLERGSHPRAVVNKIKADQRAMFGMPE